MTSLLPVSSALERLLKSAVPIARSEDVGLHDALGRVLAQHLTARVTHPAFDNSAMDGYAARHADLQDMGSVLTVIGRSVAGRGFAGSVGPGEAIRIFTGAPVPQGADTVLIQEDAERLPDGRIKTGFVPEKGRHIRRKGQDFEIGDTVLKSGVVLDAGRLTVAAGMNHARLPVFVRPKVAILATGDELVEPGTAPGPDQIIASNTYGVAALARENGADILDLSIVRDHKFMIEAAIARARTEGMDILVTLGGVSVGDHDLVQSTLIGMGMTLDFWRIAMRPGKPLMVGAFDGMHVLGLPGNPVSSLVCALLFLEPLVRHLGRLAPRHDRLAQAVTTKALPANDKRQDYVRARLVVDSGGNLLADPFERQDSSMMQAFANAECLIVRPVQAPALAAGAPCDILILRQPVQI